MLTTSMPGAGEAPWRFKLQSSIGLFVAIVVTCVGAVLIYFDYRNHAVLSAYRSAGSCSTPPEALTGDSCRYAGAATVTGSSRDSALSIDVTFTDLPGHSFTTRFPKSNEPSPAALATGATAQAELWSGHVTRFANVTSADNPERLPLDLAMSGWIAGSFGLLLTVICTAYVRRAWRR
jgi:hypothetical protein